MERIYGKLYDGSELDDILKREEVRANECGDPLL